MEFSGDIHNHQRVIQNAVGDPVIFLNPHHGVTIPIHTQENSTSNAQIAMTFAPQHSCFQQDETFPSCFVPVPRLPPLNSPFQDRTCQNGLTGCVISEAPLNVADFFLNLDDTTGAISTVCGCNAFRQSAPTQKVTVSSIMSLVTGQYIT